MYKILPPTHEMRVKTLCINIYENHNETDLFKNEQGVQVFNISKDTSFFLSFFNRVKLQAYKPTRFEFRVVSLSLSPRQVANQG